MADKPAANKAAAAKERKGNGRKIKEQWDSKLFIIDYFFEDWL